MLGPSHSATSAKPEEKKIYDPILELGKGVLDSLKRRFHIRYLRSSGRAYCVSGVFVGKEEAAHSGDPLTGAIHVNRDFGKGPWVRQRGEAV